MCLNTRSFFMASKDTKALKIQPRYRKGAYSSKIIPELKLSGVWLEAVGFKAGQTVTILVEQNQLTIKTNVL